jgi:hypothetical protein
MGIDSAVDRADDLSMSTDEPTGRHGERPGTRLVPKVAPRVRPTGTEMRQEPHERTDDSRRTRTDEKDSSRENQASRSRDVAEKDLKHIVRNLHSAEDLIDEVKPEWGSIAAATTASSDHLEEIQEMISQAVDAANSAVSNGGQPQDIAHLATPTGWTLDCDLGIPGLGQAKISVNLESRKVTLANSRDHRQVENVVNTGPGPVARKAGNRERT